MAYLGNTPNPVTSPTSLIVDNFTGNDTTGPFTLSVSPGAIQNVDIHVGGVYQFKNTYTIIGTVITFTEGPPSGVLIEAVYGR